MKFQGNILMPPETCKVPDATYIHTYYNVYKTLCPKQMLVHKVGQINNVQLITGLQRCHSVKIFKEHPLQK